MSVTQRWARRAFLASLRGIQGGALNVVTGHDSHAFGHSSSDSTREPLEASLVVHNDRFFWRALTEADVGLGESYMDGEWSTPDLVALVRLMLRNAAVLDGQRGWAGALRRGTAGLARRLRDNTLTGSRAHIREHYDLGNEFFRLFLDEQLLYSCAVYESGNETLEQAQQRKLDLICRKLDLRPSDRVLEIGTGWGALAVWAASRYGCRVTTTTISAEQYRHAQEWTARLGECGSRITVLNQDYRELSGQFDKIVSIEMFEAVGLNHYDDYFRAVDRLLVPDGAMLLQTITLNEQQFAAYRASADWIEKYIFPGGQLASVGEIVQSLGRSTSLSVHHAENIGRHYAQTLHVWRDRFRSRLASVRALGFSDRFIRMWDLYLAYCEAAFLERHAGDFQLLLTKNYSALPLFNEPWKQESLVRSA